jgi:hypothetical protein
MGVDCAENLVANSCTRPSEVGIESVRVSSDEEGTEEDDDDGDEDDGNADDEGDVPVEKYAEADAEKALLMLIRSVPIAS